MVESGQSFVNLRLGKRGIIAKVENEAGVMTSLPSIQDVMDSSFTLNFGYDSPKFSYV